jgi:hypothetical protein
LFCCEIWNEKLSEDERWQEIFQRFKREDIPLKNASAVVEFSLSQPGINEAVKRMFHL